MPCGIEMIKQRVFFRHMTSRLARIDTGNMLGARLQGEERKSPSIGKAVKHSFICCILGNKVPHLALIEEKSRFLPFLDRNEKEHSIFLDNNLLGTLAE